MRPPSLLLRDRAKLLEFVWNEVTGPQSDKDLRFMALDMGSHIRITPPTSDQAALREARRWNLKPLANLLRNHPALLGLEARNLIADILEGKKKRKPGALKKRPHERETPAKFAAELVPGMKECLLRYYPELSRGEARDMAIELCSIKLNVPETTIMKMMRRPKGDRRRHDPQHRR